MHRHSSGASSRIADGTDHFDVLPASLESEVSGGEGGDGETNLPRCLSAGAAFHGEAHSGWWRGVKSRVASRFLLGLRRDRAHAQTMEPSYTWTFHEEIGKGANGRVYKGSKNFGADNKIYAMKKLPRNSKLTGIERLRANNPNRTQSTVNPGYAKIQREVAIMKKCDHPNVVKFIDFIELPDEGAVCLVMEYMPEGEMQWRRLVERVDDNDSYVPLLTLSQIRRAIRDVVLGLEYLHFQDVVHRDIKPSNLLYTNKRSQVKISDFGVASLVTPDSPIHPNVGTPTFCPPEIAPYGDGPIGSVTVAVDWWALGITLYMLLFAETPFEPDPDAVNAIAREQSLYRSIREDRWTARLPKRMSSEDVEITAADWEEGGVMHLLDGLLRKDPNERFGIDAVKNHAWLSTGLKQPDRWVELTTPKIHPPLLYPPDAPDDGLPPPSSPKSVPAKKISVSKRDEANAIKQPRFKWSNVVERTRDIGRRVGAYLRTTRDGGAHKDPESGQGAWSSEPASSRRRRERDRLATPKGRRKDPQTRSHPATRPESLNARPRKSRGGLFPAGGSTPAALYSVEALGNRPSAPDISGGVVISSGSGTVNRVGAASPSRPLNGHDAESVFDEPENVAEQHSPATTSASPTHESVAVGMSLVVIPRRPSGRVDGDTSSVCSSEYGQVQDPPDSEYEAMERRADVYADSSSEGGSEHSAPIEFKRRVRSTPVSPGGSSPPG
ncbi:Protein kinase domain-containing protein [Mycena kentingensis (nom. inval.)]|nr:Protein kinase domain-containing protein [Mycena kentingensis (nom. inval.)]